MQRDERPFAVRLGAAIARTPRALWWLLALFLLGLALRVGNNDVPAYSPADEAHYVRAAKTLHEKGFFSYGDLVREYTSDREKWLYPTPLRWGYYGAAALTCAVRTPCDARALGWLSTVAGAFSVVFVYLLATSILGWKGRAAAENGEAPDRHVEPKELTFAQKTGLVAAALTVTSPLQSALSRRALNDELYCVAATAAVWALFRLIEVDGGGKLREYTRRAVLFVTMSTLAFATKEVFLFPFAGLAAVYLLSKRPLKIGAIDIVLFALPPALFFFVYALLAADWTSFARLVELLQASFQSEYSLRYQSGPAHRPLFDLLILAPIVTVAAIYGLIETARRARKDEAPKGVRALGFWVVIVLTAFALLPKNARFLVVLDPAMRVFAAWAWLACFAVGKAWARATAVALGVNGAVELALFYRVFVAEGTYDPTTHGLLSALGAIPRRGVQGPAENGTLLFLFGLGLAIPLLLFAGRSGVSDDDKKNDAPTEPVVTQAALKRERWITWGIGAASVIAAFVAGRTLGTPAIPSGANVDAATAEVNAGVAESNPENAVKRFQKALEINPKHYGAHFQLARALDNAGRKDEAAAQWQRVLKLAEEAKDEALVAAARRRLGESARVPGDPMAQGLDALYTRKDYALAVSLFREVLAKNPNHYGATFQLATALSQMGDAAAARSVWQKMLTLADSSGDAKTVEMAKAAIAKIDEQSGAAKPDSNVSGTAASSDPAGPAMQKAVELLYTKRDAAGAAVELRKMLATWPDHYGATYQLAVALDQSGKPAEARPLWEKALKMATAANDGPTMAAARERLAKKP
ncbi:MAG: tetratricopeptide repeat protein [Polyangiaceae bacterium]|nr:tetratricopeptide repeat protein [Polyangiaceae bacterium]